MKISYKKYWFVILILSFTTMIFAKKKLEIHFFGSSTCGECHELKVEIIEPLALVHSDSLDIKFHDTNTDSGMNLLIQFEKNFGITNGSAQEVFFPDTSLIGFEDIAISFESHLKSYLSDKSKWKTKCYPTAKQLDHSKSSNTDLLKSKVESFSFWAIVGLGIIDGINPCAIATMIFLISFLAANKRSRKDILIIGISYTSAVFVTYTIIGIVTFEFLTVLKQAGFISIIIKWSAVLLAASVGIFSFVDAFRFNKTGDTKKITLQLPMSIKKQIHKVINGNMKQQNLIAGTIITGILVTLLETFCTGQTYLPAIQAMVRSSDHRFEGLARLLFYNILFVLPLLLVMIGTYFGLTWNELAKKTQKNMVLLKVILGIVMTLLALYLALS